MSRILLSEEEFMNQFKAGMVRAFGDDKLFFDEQVVNRTNEMEVRALAIRINDENVAPVIYPDTLYRQYREGFTVDEMVERYSSKLHRTPDFVEDVREAINNHRDLTGQFRLSLVNTAMNQEMLKSVPHEEHGDLSAIVRLRISDEASIVVSNQLATRLEMTREEVLDIAHRHLEQEAFTTRGMSEVMRDILQKEGMQDDEVRMILGASNGDKEWIYVVTNDIGIDGSVAILSDDVMQRSHEVVGEDFYVLPSSRHEVILVPESVTDSAEELRLIVSDANQSVVERTDYLSDNIYHYSGHDHRLVACFDSEGERLEHGDIIMGNSYEEDEPGVSDEGIGYGGHDGL